MTDRMISHWWWRPGWSVGRSFYTWHLTFENGSEVAQLADRYRPVLSTFPGLDVLTTGQLHLTIQGVGFTDAVSNAAAQKIVTAARSELSMLTVASVGVGKPYVDSETVQVAITPTESIASVRLALRRAIASVWDADRVPESVEGFRSHVTLAYSNTEQERSTIEEAVGSVEQSTVEFTVQSVSLIQMNRDKARYEWTEMASVSLGDV